MATGVQHTNGARREAVKWATPAEELVSVARIACALVKRGACDASTLLLAVPSANWGVRLERACEAAGLAASFCVPHARLSAAARARLARLDVLANPHAEAARQAAAEVGVSSEEADALVRSYADARAFTLVRALGLRESFEFKHVLSRVQGDEDAAQLARLVREQLEAPTFPAGSEEVAIVHYLHGRGLGPEAPERVVIVGCVDGLVPAAPGADPTQQQAARAAAREAFEACLARARSSATVSYFTRVDERVARAAGIAFARTKLQDGQRVAMCRPSPFIAEWGCNRPGTTGGQALLRSYGLN